MYNTNCPYNDAMYILYCISILVCSLIEKWMLHMAQGELAAAL